MQDKPENKKAKKVAYISSVAAVVSITILTALNLHTNNKAIEDLIGSIANGGDSSTVIEGLKSTNFIWSIAFALACALIYQGLCWLFSAGYKWFWMNKRHKRTNITGTWFLYQTVPNDDYYFRIGTVEIIQEYDQILMTANTCNVKYAKDSNYFQPYRDNGQTTHWIEYGSAKDTSSIQGIYSADRKNPTENLNGLHEITIDEYDTNGYPIIMSGSFIDAAFGKNMSRYGQLFFYKNSNKDSNNEKGEEEVRQLCRERCDKLKLSVFVSRITPAP